jgi:hypothetical protein
LVVIGVTVIIINELADEGVTQNGCAEVCSGGKTMKQVVGAVLHE